MMDGVVFFNIAIGGYALSLFLYVFSRVFHRPRLGAIGTGVLSGSFAAQTLGLILRSVGMGMLAVTNTYETLIFYSWVTVVAYLVVEVVYWKNRNQLRLVGMFTAGIAFAMIALAASPLFPTGPRPLAPVLRSHWFIMHVGGAIVGEGFFAVAFASSALLLVFDWRKRGGRGDPPFSLDLLDAISYKSIAIGFPLFTMGGLFFGAIWAQHAWGRYWGWDPKETFALVTWLVYVVYLHLRVGFGWRGRRVAWVAVLGFLLALFTFAGVNYLLPGLHGYR